MRTEAITKFWQSWPTLRPLIEKELAAGEYGEGTEGLTEAVEAIDPHLEWELMEGHRATHALAMSSAAEPRLRHVTKAWADAAPEPDGTWEYHPARIAVGPESLELDGMLLDPLEADMVVIVDPESETLDLQVGHPDFAGIDETLRFQAAFRFIDDLLGEDDAEQWIGSVDVVDKALPWGTRLSMLPDDIVRLKDAATHEQWATVEVNDPELGRSVLVVNRALKRLSNLNLTLHVQVSIELAADATTSTADAVEDQLEEVLGDHGFIYARETFATFVAISAYCEPQRRGAIVAIEDDHPAIYDLDLAEDPGWDNFEEQR